MNTPKKFNLFGNDIKVKRVNIIAKDECILGQANFVDNIILLKKVGNKDSEFATFCHELVHFLFFYACPQLLTDEEKTELVGQLLYQFLKSSKY
jgi:hypothetical protein